MYSSRVIAVKMWFVAGVCRRKNRRLAMILKIHACEGRGSVSIVCLL